MAALIALAAGVGWFMARRAVSGVEAVIPVPLHPAKEKSRGFNQARLLARGLAKRKNLPLLARRLLKETPRRCRSIPTRA
jgi:predicted amidophosphoribosyltransferase